MVCYTSVRGSFGYYDDPAGQGYYTEAWWNPAWTGYWRDAWHKSIPGLPSPGSVPEGTKMDPSSVWICEQPLNGYESDGCGNRRANPACNPPQFGNISFASNPPGAEIFLDGADQGLKTPSTVSNVPTGSHSYALKLAGYNDITGTVSVALNLTATVTANLTSAYREATLVSCSFPANAVAGQTYQGTITVNQGSLTENYKLMFSGDLTGESIPFTVNAGTGQQIIVSSMVFPTGGPKTVTASLVKI